MKITYSRLKVDTLSTLAKRTIETSQKPEFTTLVKDNPLLAQLQSTYDAYFGVFNKDIYSGLGETVRNADLKRDTYYRGLLRILLSMASMDGMSLQQDAKELTAYFEPFGFEITAYSYGDESAYLNKLIEALDKPEVITKLEKLNLKEPFELFKQSQIDFEQLFSSQVKANASLRDMESATSLKSTLIHDLRNYLNMVSVMQGVDAWKGFYSELNQLAKAAENSTLNPRVVMPKPPGTQG